MLLQPGSRPVPNYPDYILIRKLGAGAFGQVWHAHGPGGVDAALKFIRLNARIFALERRSLEVMKKIRHPNLVSLFGAWHEDNWLVLAMELCDCTLHDRLIEALEQNLPGIPLEELLTYISDAADGLDALNEQQVQHRDVKPANLLLLGSGVKVADFGLAKALEQTVGSNSGAGTISYMAPECFNRKLTPQSDQYSLAVTYYHLRTGELLFEGNHAQIMYGHLELPPDLSRVPAAEAAVLARALDKEPGKRWANCRTFFAELSAARQEMEREAAEQRKRLEERKREEERQRQEVECGRFEEARQRQEAERRQLEERRQGEEAARRLLGRYRQEAAAKAQEEPDGESLGQILHGGKRLEEGEAIRVIAQVAKALCRTHHLGAIHGDVKPDNIIITGDRVHLIMGDQVKSPKFGYAPAGFDVVSLRPAELLYKAPEQCVNAVRADVRSDVYSLGATLYHMVTGEAPFAKISGPVEIWSAKAHNQLASGRTIAPDLSERVDQAIRRAMAADPKLRPADCHAFIADLTGSPPMGPDVAA